jgi:hypothetical protein
VLIAFIILAWKVCCYNRRKKTTGESNSKEDHHHPPYPQPPSEIYEATKNLGPNSCKWPPRSISEFLLTNFISIATSTLVDPYLITNSFNNSLISQDDSFKRMEMPEPVLKWKESVNHSAFNLPMQKVAQPFELDSTTIKLHDDDNKESIPCTYLICTLLIAT